jgi:hypothetical protein
MPCKKYRIPEWLSADAVGRFPTLGQPSGEKLPTEIILISGRSRKSLEECLRGG